jgi:precorrin-2 dehydrogenase / sirohydrochlorin ferrochelatase
MSNYPVFLNIAHFNCLVVGGGKVAARKVLNLVEAGAKPLIITQELSAELELIVQEHQLNVQLRGYEVADMQGFQLVIAATNNKALNDAIAQQAIDLNVLVNNISNATMCNFQVPAVVRRQGIELAIGTGGELPYLSHQLKKYFEEQLTTEKLEMIDQIIKIRKDVLALNKDNNTCKKQLLDAELLPLVDEFIKKTFS